MIRVGAVAVGSLIAGAVLGYSLSKQAAHALLGLARVAAHCSGNIETFSRSVITPSVSYEILYWTKESKGQVSISGQVIETKVSYGSTFKGPWFFRTENPYLSFVPNDGTLKYNFEEGKWFSGTCVQSSLAAL